MITRASRGAIAAFLALSMGTAAAAQQKSYDPPVKTLPPNVQYNVDLAFLLLNGDLSKDRLPQVFLGGGVIPNDGKTPLQDLNAHPTVVPPFAAFDQLYYFGMNTVGSWALKTSAGIILFDTLNNTEEAQRIIEGGMRKVGLDPAQIKYIVITHGHADHYGGAKYLQDKYHPHILMGAGDWELAQRAPPAGAARRGPEPPAHDIDVTDGQKLTLGNTTVELYLTPGHTPATVSAIIPVTDRGRPHRLAFWGGTGFPNTLDPNPRAGGLRIYQQQLFRFTKIALDEHVDGIIANHAVADGTPAKAELMRRRKPTDPNPYVLGQSTFLRVMGSFIVAIEAAKQVREQQAGARAEGAAPDQSRRLGQGPATSQSSTDAVLR